MPQQNDHRGQSGAADARAHHPVENASIAWAMYWRFVFQTSI